jgi:hypothetical protein
MGSRYPIAPTGNPLRDHNRVEESTVATSQCNDVES